MSGVGGMNSMWSVFKVIQRAYGKAQKWIIYGLFVDIPSRSDGIIIQRI